MRKSLIVALGVMMLAGCSKSHSEIKSGASGEGVDDLFATLEGKTAPAPAGGVNAYAMQIKSAIQSHLHDAGLYAGKECSLRITLAPDGMLIAVRAEGGDPALCRAAIKATTNARFPKPPSQVVYGDFKNAVLEFRPQ
ncbi:cell envelope integrity protein TolA [Serratia proteamaculans]|uniref:Cell envelope integrity protein TolA n=1 Tax=Serratia proteamaculans TaxID=28151 RepID=A0A7U0N6X1_SERPR|nr:cell envelope integrity protein TolA [Serratia proteamaculans]MBO1502709.1 cell envelope integrity protein TolA [Serratia proteamaculans]QQX53637.1 cell envelope integrity protein TolA [Serratia proteamaculans]